MNDQEMFHALEKLECINSDVQLLRESFDALAPNSKIREALSKIWDASEDIKRMLCSKDLLDRYRQDAVEQAERVWELVQEYNGIHDDQQLASIGYASDLAAVRIKKYYQMANFAVQIEGLADVVVAEFWMHHQLLKGFGCTCGMKFRSIRLQTQKEA